MPREHTKNAMAARKRQRAHLAAGEVRYAWGADANASEHSNRAAVAVKVLRVNRKAKP